MRILMICVAMLVGCAGSQPPRQVTPIDDPTKAPLEHRAGAPGSPVTPDQCEAQAGQVVGDIGDGATHRPGYVCPSGKPPLGDVVSPAGAPIASEGSVCCPR